MAVDFQIEQSTVAQIMIDWAQRALSGRCQPPAPGRLVDRLDVVPGDTTLLAVEGRLLVKISVQVHLVTEAAVMAAPNTSPVIDNVGRAVVELALVADGTSLRMRNGDHDLSGLALSEIEKAFVKTLIVDFVDSAPAPAADFGPRFGELGLPSPALSRIEQDFGIVAIRFDPAGPLVRHLAPSTTWGLFLDAPAVVSLVAARMTALPVQPQLTWAPDGLVPRVNFSLRQIVRREFTVTVDMLIDTGAVDIVVHADVTLWGSARFSLGPGPILRTDLEWDMDLDIADLGLVSEFIAEQFIENEVRDQLRTQLLAAIQGETVTGPNSLFLSRPLARFPFLGAQMSWSSLRADAAGMTLGGSALRSQASWAIPSFAVQRFGSPIWRGRCRERARAGDGSPPRTFSIWDVEAVAGVSFEGATLCRVVLLPPNEGLQSRLNITGGSAGFRLKAAQAGVIRAPVRLVVYTSRGVRLVDLGMPNVEVDGVGKVANVAVHYLKDCLHLSGPLLKLAIGETLTTEDFKPPPLEVDDWATRIGARFDLKAQLVHVEGLEPSEIVRFETPFHRLTLLADERGGLRIPALVPLGPVVSAATVSRMYDRAFPDSTKVETVDFRWIATTEAGAANWLRDVDGTPRIMQEGREGRTLSIFLATEQEGFVSLDAAADDGLNPQPLPPGPPPELMELARAAGIADYEAVSAFPGFEDEAIAIVSVREDNQLVVERDGAGNARVSGRWEGPLAPLQIHGGFALAVSGSDLLLFSTERVRETMPG